MLKGKDIYLDYLFLVYGTLNRETILRDMVVVKSSITKKTFKKFLHMH